MIFHFTRSFEIKTRKLCEKNPRLKKDFVKQFRLFKSEPSHPSLKWHKLKGKRSEQYAMWIQGDLRALAIKDKEVYIFFDLVTHDEY